MPGQPPPHTDELELLLAFIAQQRDGVRYAAYGLTEAQAHATPCRSSLSLGGLLRHVAVTEAMWTEMVAGSLGQAPAAPQDGEAGAATYVDSFSFGPEDSVAAALAAYDEVAARTEAVARSAPSLDHPVPVPKGVPWFPDDVDAWSVRWVLLHVIEETARHAGHADIIRESLDGATMFELMAGVEGWPATEWLIPWQPPAA